jgi:hypothetical protein
MSKYEKYLAIADYSPENRLVIPERECPKRA